MLTLGTWKENIKKILNVNICTGCYSSILPTWGASGLPYLMERKILELRNSLYLFFFWFYRIKSIIMRNCFSLAESLVITLIPFSMFFHSYCCSFIYFLCSSCIDHDKYSYMQVHEKYIYPKKCVASALSQHLQRDNIH